LQVERNNVLRYELEVLKAVLLKIQVPDIRLWRLADKYNRWTVRVNNNCLYIGWFNATCLDNTGAHRVTVCKGDLLYLTHSLL
jgi:hypothetical protein